MKVQWGVHKEMVFDSKGGWTLRETQSLQGPVLSVDGRTTSKRWSGNRWRQDETFCRSCFTFIKLLNLLRLCTSVQVK